MEHKAMIIGEETVKKYLTVVQAFPRLIVLQECSTGQDYLRNSGKNTRILTESIK